jgi:hypothetical protein
MRDNVLAGRDKIKKFEFHEKDKPATRECTKSYFPSKKVFRTRVNLNCFSANIEETVNFRVQEKERSHTSSVNCLVMAI